MRHLKASEYPKTVYIHDESYEVRVVKRIPGENPDCHGLCDFGRKIIWIRSNQSPKGLFRTFLHEVLHAMSHEFSFKLNHPTVYSLEIALESFFSDNSFIGGK